MFTLQFSTDNDAFQDNLSIETARQLRQAADKIETSSTLDGLLVDANGNRIGTWRFST